MSMELLKSEDRYTSLGSTYNTQPNPALLVTHSCVTSIPSDSKSTLDSASNSTSFSDPHDQFIPAPSASSPLDSSTLQSTETNGRRMDSERTTPLPELVEGKAPTPKLRYKPAYELLDGSLERAGRGASPAQKG